LFFAVPPFYFLAFTAFAVDYSERDVPIRPEYRDILHKMWQYGEGKSNFFLFTQLKHNRLSPSGLSSFTRKLFKRLGFPAKELSLHSGRHTPPTLQE
jgi:integrase